MYVTRVVLRFVQAKDDYQKRKEKEGKKVENWMLPSVSSRLDRHHDDPQDRDISKNDKYKREMKTPKKKKNKNKKYKEKPSESSQSDSDSSKVIFQIFSTLLYIVMLCYSNT